MKKKIQIGKEMHKLAKRLFPICRSITGNGVRETLSILREEIPLKVHEIPTGTKVFDWIIPKEWNISEAWIEDSVGNRIIDFAENNLHVVGYSTPIDAKMSLLKLQKHLYSIPGQPNAIPYVTSYYKEQWGFCMKHTMRKKLRNDTYHVCIKSKLTRGSLTYGELIIPGKSEKEVFLSTYTCHPSMANNELSGPVVTTYIAKWLQDKPRTYTYRIIFIPETIGSITYLFKNIDVMKKNIIAGFNITCVGDDRAYSFLPSRNGSTIADRVARRILQKKHPDFKLYSFLDRGSDERQYCAPGVDLPVVSIMRSKYREYPEYHSSLDNLTLVTPTGLQGSFDVLKECIENIENNTRYQAIFLGEPQLGKRGLYSTLSRKGQSKHNSKLYLDILTYADGTNDIEDLEKLLRIPKKKIVQAINKLLEVNLIREV